MTEEQELKEKLEHLEHLRYLGEKAYGDMYEMHTFRDASVCFRDAREFFHDAVRLADELELAEDANYLRNRIEHIKWIFRRQFGE